MHFAISAIFGSIDPPRFLAAAALLCLLAGPAAAADPGQEAYMVRMLSCAGPDAGMEVYLPQSIAFGQGLKPGAKPVIGYYALDLSAANKGKMLEPVRVSLSADGKTVVVDQYTRGLKPTRIPTKGGTVDFDQRFGTAAKCGAFQTQD
jgi:hypothetical protein